MHTLTNLGWWLKYWFSRTADKRCPCAQCKKITFRTQRYSVKDKNGKRNCYIQQPTDKQYCVECLSGSVVICPWCQDSIHPGDPITLYSPRKEDFEIPEGAMVYKTLENGRKQLVGCLGWNCAESGMDRSGFWIPPGKVERVPSPLEMVMANPGSVVINNDLSNPSEPTRVVKPS